MEPIGSPLWQRRLGPGWDVVRRTSFGARYGLASAFPGANRPDMVAVHPGRRLVLVGDVTSAPDAAHLAKTVAYARRLAARRPPGLSDFRVAAQDWYWALPPEWAGAVGRPRGGSSSLRPARTAVPAPPARCSPSSRAARASRRACSPSF